jgi:glycosyltransferase involved in cell wall biosynthesis
MARLHKRDSLLISVIIPFFNSKKFIERNLVSLTKQNVNLEIIMIDDGSEDKGRKILSKFKHLNIKTFVNKKNFGPSASRNIGILQSKGEYLYFLDIDDTLKPNALKILSKKLKNKNFDLIFSDKAWIKKKKNIRKNIYIHKTDKIFKKKKIIKIIKSRFKNPSTYVSIFDATGKLIKRNILIENKIFFENKLRYLEDEVFMWKVLSKIKNAKYIKKQLYNYYIHENISTGLSLAFIKNFDIENFFIIKNSICDALKNLNLNNNFIKNFSSHAIIFFVISALISLCKSVLLNKISYLKGMRILRTLIKKILKNKKIIQFATYYKPNINESSKIPLAIKINDANFLEQSILDRTKKLLKNRKIISKKKYM